MEQDYNQTLIDLYNYGVETGHKESGLLTQLNTYEMFKKHKASQKILEAALDMNEDQLKELKALADSTTFEQLLDDIVKKESDLFLNILNTHESKFKDVPEEVYKDKADSLDEIYAEGVKKGLRESVNEGLVHAALRVRMSNISKEEQDALFADVDSENPQD